MVETFTSAVCGSRVRQHLAIAFFAAAALVASAALGAVLGLAGSMVGTRPALIGAAVIAFLAALRETGLVRLPLPPSRRHVPERWRSELPLTLWSAGYGSGRGSSHSSPSPPSGSHALPRSPLVGPRSPRSALPFTERGGPS